MPLEARRVVRERRTALEAIEKAHARTEREEEWQRAREERERNSPVIGANFMVAGVLYENRANVVEHFAAPEQRGSLSESRKIRTTQTQFSSAWKRAMTSGMSLGTRPQH